jgi:Flp pilus assembly protein TadG
MIGPAAGRGPASGRGRVSGRGSATWRGSASERGSASLELAVAGPALLALLGLVIVAGRVVAAGSAVEQAAAAGARAASLARDARSAQTQAERIARDSLADQGVACAPLTARVDTAGFAVRVGAAASVTVQVSCSVAIGDLAVPGMPGHRVVRAEVSSPLDRFRARS